MTREKVIALAESKGLQARPCPADGMMAVNVGKAEDSNERMRLTDSGQLLVVDEGCYWQVGTTEEWAKHLNEEKPYATQAAMVESQTQGRMQVDPVTGDVSIGTIRAKHLQEQPQ